METMLKKSPKKDFRRKWKDEHIDYLMEIYKGKMCAETAEMINMRFGTSYTKEQVQSFLGNHGLKNGYVATFKKGSIPKNKGKKWDEYLSKESQDKCRKNCFEKGHISANNVPIGTITIRKDKNGMGYRYIKIKDGVNHSNFMLYARYLYEKTYSVKLKPNHVVIHLDGNSLNDSIDNLFLADKKETGILNKSYKVTNEKERTKASLLTIRLDQKLKEINECQN